MIFKGIASFWLKHSMAGLNRKVKVYNLHSAKSALLLYDAGSEQTEKKNRNFARFLKEEGVKVDSIGFYRKKGKTDQKPLDELTYYYVDQHQFNWFGMPKQDHLKKMLKNDYHLLIDLNFEQHFYLKYFSGLSKAHFKVGMAKGYQKEFCDLLIEMKNDDLDFFINQVKHYLKMINSNPQ